MYKELKTPDLTWAQLTALIAWLLSALATLGFDVRPTIRDTILQMVTALGGFLIGGDAVIRHGRSKVEAARIHANLQAATTEMAMARPEPLIPPPGIPVT